MSRFNTRNARPAATSPVTTTGAAARTAEGATGHLRDDRSELFLLAVANTVGTDTFYEKADDRDDRYRQLVRKLAVEDPDWTAALLRWLRTEGNLRTASLVGAVEYVHARLAAAGSRTPRQHETHDRAGRWEGDALSYSTSTNRAVVASVLQRADEPGELLAYWTSRFGRNIPKPVKRGIEDAVGQLYTERALLKYDSPSKGFRFGDVLELTHPSPKAAWQGDLFKHAIDRRHNRDNPIPEALGTLHARAFLDTILAEERRAYLKTSGAQLALKDAGMTWESLAGWLQGPLGAAEWESVIPSMGYMALLRNLRNFDQAGVSDEVAEQVAARLADPAEVARSRQFPFRFWAAHKHVTSLRWGHALEKALTASLANVPVLPGRTLILVDRSPSMFPGYHYSTANTSDIPLAEQAALFGSALALRAADPTLVEFGGSSRQIPVPRGGSVLRLMEAFGQDGGTDIPSAVAKHYRGHDRVLIVTDEQTQPGYLPSNMLAYGGARETAIDDLIPRSVPVYMWNMAGYKAGAMASGSGNRHALGGLTDSAFALIPLLDAGRNADWPWTK
ncbi:TROVE domain-containing protein [Kitasatospora sp. NPDC086791]|uniref:TROVE domain-containing protein n=1 Tax=Kitasatospora sp. NPDC086791 TaxID=3155178 RepID=UPI00342C355D